MTTPLTPPDNWAERKLRELKARGQNPDKPYVFLTSCVDARGEDIDEMTSSSTEVSYDEINFNCDLLNFEEVMGYGRKPGELHLPADTMVTFNRGFYKGCPCYYIEHSRIEYIWVNARTWKAEKVLSALERAGIEVDVP